MNVFGILMLASKTYGRLRAPQCYPMQLMGGYGFNKEYKMERRVRDSFGWGIAGGTIDVQKVNIASAMIGRRFNQRAK